MVRTQIFIHEEQLILKANAVVLALLLVAPPRRLVLCRIVVDGTQGWRRWRLVAPPRWEGTDGVVVGDLSGVVVDGYSS